MSSKITLLVCSCDKYEDAWIPYFKLLKKYWSNVEQTYDIVLNTETKSIKVEDFEIKTFNLYKDKKRPEWGKRMKDTLKLIETELVLVVLEDFFLIDYVDEERLNQCIDWLREDKEAVCFNFMPVIDKNNKISEKYQGFVERPLKGDYKFNCQACLWKRDELIKFMRNFENPWQWETYGNLRSHRMVNKKFYAVNNNENLIIPYDRGFPIFRGKWFLEHIDEHFKSNNIFVNYENLGIHSVNTNQEEIQINRQKKKSLYMKIKDFLFEIKLKLIMWRSLF